MATRPSDRNGLGFTPEEAWQEVSSIERFLTLLPDAPAIYTEWKRLVKDYRVQGVRVYDARLVAAMRVYGVEQILTFNVDDFKRYSATAMYGRFIRHRCRSELLSKLVCFVIWRASATIKTLLFNLLECRNRYGIEV